MCSKMSRTRLRLGSIYLATTLVAALLYWLAWLRSPDHFVVQQEVNLYPIASLSALLWQDLMPTLPQSTSGLAELTTEANRIIVTARALRERQAQLQTDVARLEQDLRNISQVLEQNRAKRIGEYRRTELAPLEEEKARLERQIAELEKPLTPDRNTYDPLRTVVAEARVELARLDLRIAEKRLEVATRIVRDFGQLAKPEDFERWKTVDYEATRVRGELSDTSARYAKLRGETFDLMAKWRRQREERLGLVDFLYFSLGVSTTTTFGDIIPNHTVTRAMVTVQLLISVVTVGLFVNSLSARPSDRGGGGQGASGKA